MKVLQKPTTSITPYARNPRDNAAAVSKVAGSIKEFGWQQPIVVDSEMVIIAGHTRLLAAQQLGLAKVPVVIASDLTTAQVKAYRLADNRTAQEAEWDNELLGLELQDLEGLDFDMQLIGFDDDELHNLMVTGTEEGLTDPDDTPPLEDDAVTSPGDIWILGRHRLMCGDSTSAENVRGLLAGVEPHLMVTDPPYGVEYDANWRNDAERANGEPYGATAIGKVENDDQSDWSEAWALFPGDVVYIWHAAWQSAALQMSLESCGFDLRSEIVWAKPRFAISRGHYHWQHESCWYAVRKGKTGHWSGDRSQTTLWQIAHNKSETGHSTQKPVEAMRRPIENNSSPGQAVYEPFSGSGTTIIAAEQTGRICYAIEIEPRYVDMAVRRWQEFTGEQATLEKTGKTFDDCVPVTNVE